MFEALTVFAIVAALLIGVAVLGYLLVRPVLDFMRAESGRVYIALKALASLAAWILASWGWLLMLFVTVYNASGNGSAAEEERLDAWTLLLLDFFYALIGGGLVFWVGNKSGKRG